MAKIKFVGFEDYAEQIGKMAKNTDAIIKPAVYDGAAVMAKAFEEELARIPVDDTTKWGTADNPMRGLKSRQKQGLIKSFGITSMRNENGFINVRLGFDGYNNIRSKKHPNGQPNALIARSLEKGTSFMLKYPFSKKAIRSAKQKSIDAMQATINEKIYSL